jgi:hypothetical protein
MESKMPKKKQKRRKAEVTETSQPKPMYTGPGAVKPFSPGEKDFDPTPTPPRPPNEQAE